LRDIGSISSFSRVLSLGTLLLALIGFLGVMLSAVLALSAASARRAGVLADLASRSNSTVDLLLSAASHWAAERGSMNGALNAQAPVAEYGWVAAPASGGWPLDRACHPAFVWHQALNGKERRKPAQMHANFSRCHVLYSFWQPSTRPIELQINQLDRGAQSECLKRRCFSLEGWSTCCGIALAIIGLGNVSAFLRGLSLSGINHAPTTDRRPRKEPVAMPLLRRSNRNTPTALILAAE